MKLITFFLVVAWCACLALCDTNVDSLTCGAGACKYTALSAASKVERSAGLSKVPPARGEEWGCGSSILCRSTNTGRMTAHIDSLATARVSLALTKSVHILQASVTSTTSPSPSSTPVLAHRASFNVGGDSGTAPPDQGFNVCPKAGLTCQQACAQLINQLEHKTYACVACSTSSSHVTHTGYYFCNEGLSTDCTEYPDTFSTASQTYYGQFGLCSPQVNYPTCTQTTHCWASDASCTASTTASPTPSQMSESVTASRTPTGTRTPSETPTHSKTPSETPTHSKTRSVTRSRSTTRSTTPTISVSSSVSPTPSFTSTPTPRSVTSSPTRTPTATRSPSQTPFLVTNTSTGGIPVYAREEVVMYLDYFSPNYTVVYSFLRYMWIRVDQDSQTVYPDTLICCTDSGRVFNIPPESSSGYAYGYLNINGEGADFQVEPGPPVELAFFMTPPVFRIGLHATATLYLWLTIELQLQPAGNTRSASTFVVTRDESVIFDFIPNGSGGGVLLMPTLPLEIDDASLSESATATTAASPTAVTEADSDSPSSSPAVSNVEAGSATPSLSETYSPTESSTSSETESPSGSNTQSLSASPASVSPSESKSPSQTLSPTATSSLTATVSASTVPLVVVTLLGGPQYIGAGSMTYLRVTLSTRANVDVHVALELAGTAVRGTDYVLSPDVRPPVITIPAGQLFAVLQISCITSKPTVRLTPYVNVPSSSVGVATDSHLSYTFVLTAAPASYSPSLSSSPSFSTSETSTESMSSSVTRSNSFSSSAHASKTPTRTRGATNTPARSLGH